MAGSPLSRCAASNLWECNFASIEVKIYLLVFGLSCGLLGIGAAGAQTAQSGMALTENPVFRKNCAKCHGKTAEGRHFGGPSLVSGKVTAMSANDLREIISNGKGRMPKYSGKLAVEEIDTLIRQIKAQQTRAQQTNAPDKSK